MAKTNAEKRAYYKEYYQNNKKKKLERDKIYYQQHKEKYRKYSLKSKHKHKNMAKQFINLYKSKLPCLCGESDYRCLDFHHINPDNKKKAVAELAAEGYNIPTIQAEIDKCEILCSNCHRKQHFKNSSPKNPKAKHVYELKLDRRCTKCGESHIACLDFHHIQEKIDNIGTMVRDKQYSIEDLKLEIDKCIILCSNCHRKEHSEYINYD